MSDPAASSGPTTATLDQLRDLLGAVVPFASHVGVEITEIADGRAVARLSQRPEHLNHVATLHAGALYTLAEAASGAAMSGAFADQILNVRPVVGTAAASYRRSARGDMTAHAVVDADTETLRSDLAGTGRVTMAVEVAVADDDGREVASFCFDWVITSTTSVARA